MKELSNIDYIETNFKVKSKAKKGAISHLITMKLWSIQRFYLSNRTIRNIVLKPRQVGFSTCELAGNSHILFTTPYQDMIVVTHDQETSEFLLTTIDRFYLNLPKDMRPKRDWNSGSRMRFPILDSYLYIDSAKSDNIGVGHGLNRAHLSEVAKWPPKKAGQLWADITQTIPMEGYITAESTPQGRGGLFYELYQDAKKGINGFTPFFFPWWLEDEYVSDPETQMTPQKAEIVANILNQGVPEFLRDEQNLANNNKLSPEQLAFRRLKLGEIKIMFFQEYPENDIDCWLTSDLSVVDPSIIRTYNTMVRHGRTEGSATFWEDVVGGRRYIMGVDVAAGYAKGDFSVASVLDTRSMKYVARIRGRIPPDLFGEEVYRLGKRYNEALIGVERTGHGHSVIRVLLEKEYPNIYYHIDYDEMQKRVTNEPGWKTTVKTKPMMVSDLLAAMRANDLVSYSENFLEEAANLVWEGQQKVKPIAGGFDDEWDAVSIAVQLREQTPIIEEMRASIQSYARV